MGIMEPEAVCIRFTAYIMVVEFGFCVHSDSQSGVVSEVLPVPPIGLEETQLISLKGWLFSAGDTAGGTSQRETGGGQK